MQKEKLKNIYLILIIVFLLVIGVVTYHFLNGFKNNNNENNVTMNQNSIKEKEEDNRKKEEYEACLNEPYKMDTLEEEFNSLFASYEDKKVAIYFTDVNNNYSFTLRPNQGYYSGCVVKIFAAIYLVEQARLGNIDLNSTYTYLAQDKRVASPLTDKHKFGEEIPITTLIDYFLSVSDNSAYFIVIRNLGADTINNYFKEKYDITLHFTNNHPFERNYTAFLGDKSLRILYDLLKVDDEYSDLIRNALNNDVENGFNFDDLKFLHKYGEYNVYHNDIGIYDTENPYLATILTLYAKEDYKKIISTLNKEMYTIYKKNLDSKEEYCKSILEI